MKPWVEKLPWTDIERAAVGRPFSARLVAAIVQAESGGVRWRTRYERDFRYTVSPESFAKVVGISHATELVHQKTSWGLMQIMGGTARDEGFQGHLPSLCEAETGLYWGCTYLQKLWERYGAKLPEVLAAYNAGKPRDVAPKDGVLDNQKYVDRVLKFYRELGE